jgi:hypothetical protein
MCDCYGTYSLLIGNNLKTLNHKESCKQFSKLTNKKELTNKINGIEKRGKKKKEGKKGKTDKTVIERLPIIGGLPKDCWLKIFYFVLWNFNYGVSYHTEFVKRSPADEAMLKILGRKSSERDALPGCADDEDNVALEYIFSTCKTNRIYFTLEDFPPIYMLRLTCKTFKAYLDEYNKKRKMFMRLGCYYKSPKDKWDYFNTFGRKPNNPYIGRFFIDGKNPM